jgi:hypothetical protein
LSQLLKLTQKVKKWRFLLTPSTTGPLNDLLKPAPCMKNAHEAAAYKGWLTQLVQEAIDDPRPNVSHCEVVADWAAERAALLKQAENVGS